VPLETPARIVRALTDRGYNAEREAVTLIANQPDPVRAIERAVEDAPEDALVLTAEHVRESIENDPTGAGYTTPQEPAEPNTTAETSPDNDPHVSGGTTDEKSPQNGGAAAVETEGSRSGETRTTTVSGGEPETAQTVETSQSETAERSVENRNIAVSGDIASVGTGKYSDFVSVFQDRYEKLSKQLRGRVNHRPADTIEQMSPGSDAALIGLVSDIRSTASGHWLVELEDTTGTFPCLIMKDREFADDVRNMLHDECVAVEGTLADDGGILFVDSLHFPDIPRTHSPSTADRPVKAALISDVHCGSEEFLEDAWQRFADWLHTPEAAEVEYLLIAGDMVEGIGVYPGQDEELEIIDIYDQYEAFSEHLKDVPGDMDIVMIPGNHDAVRLAEPQPAFDEELRDIMSAHDAQISANPSTVNVEGVSVLMYHGVSLDEVIAELPDESATYERPHDAMEQLLRKRHVAPQYGGQTRVAPEPEDHLVMEEVPDIFHTGHVHKLGYGKYHNVLMVNSSCWQSQTDFQKKVNLQPDVGYAPIIDLQTLDLTIRQFT
jgi:DNA polymerase II small subunit